MVVTLKDVASVAGVSVKTVSNVVNGYSFVKEDNRRRVEAALLETGYRPNIGARNLRRGRTGFLALVVPDLGIPYFGELSARVVSAAQSQGWNVLIEQTQGTREQERASLDTLGPHFVDGAIISPQALEAEDFSVVAPDFPMVMLGEHMVDVPIDRVAIDNVAAARTAVEHLLGLGRRRIAAIGANPDRGTARLRLRGYREALRHAHLTAEHELVAEADAYHRRDGALAMRRLLDVDDPPDAVFCFNDLLAVGALRAAAQLGVRVPDDVAVVGFDGSDESAYSIPSLTTVAPDVAALAGRAVALVGDTGRGPTQRVEDFGVPFALVVRESTVGAADADVTAPQPAVGRSS